MKSYYAGSQENAHHGIGWFFTNIRGYLARYHYVVSKKQFCVYETGRKEITEYEEENGYHGHAFP
jgi:hypothetical protein